MAKEITFRDVMQKASDEMSQYIILMSTGHIIEAMRIGDTLCDTINQINDYTHTIKTLQDILDYINLYKELMRKQKTLEENFKNIFK